MLKIKCVILILSIILDSLSLTFNVKTIELFANYSTFFNSLDFFLIKIKNMAQRNTMTNTFNIE